eukprot:scaffold108937_cov69-Phaeocystis_antarctica.AAC.2
MRPFRSGVKRGADFESCERGRRQRAERGKPGLGRRRTPLLASIRSYTPTPSNDSHSLREPRDVAEPTAPLNSLAGSRGLGPRPRPSCAGRSSVSWPAGAFPAGFHSCLLCGWCCCSPRCPTRSSVVTASAGALPAPPPLPVRVVARLVRLHAHGVRRRARRREPLVPRHALVGADTSNGGDAAAEQGPPPPPRDLVEEEGVW